MSWFRPKSRKTAKTQDTSHTDADFLLDPSAVAELDAAVQALEPLRVQQSSLVAGKTVIIMGDPYSGILSEISQLLFLGAKKVHVIGHEKRALAHISHDLDPELCEVHILPGGQGLTWEEHIQTGDVISLIRRIDPDHSAVVLSTPTASMRFERRAFAKSDGRLMPKDFTVRAKERADYITREIAVIDDRWILNARTPNLEAIEDKTKPHMLERLGLPTPFHVIVEMKRIFERLKAKSDLSYEQRFLTAIKLEFGKLAKLIGLSGDAKFPVVVSIDGTYSLPAGCEGTLFVAQFEDFASAVPPAYLKCNRIRISEFIKGIPFGTQFFIDASGKVAVFGAVEMVTAHPDVGKFEFFGVSAIWEPGEELSAHLYSQARRGAIELSRKSMRGSGTFDGVISERGPLYHEVNTRTGDGHNLLLPPEYGISWLLLDALAKTGQTLAVSMETLESTVQTARRLIPESKVTLGTTRNERGVTSTYSTAYKWEASQSRLTQLDVKQARHADLFVLWSPMPSDPEHMVIEVIMNPKTAKGPSLAPLMSALYQVIVDPHAQAIANGQATHSMHFAQEVSPGLIVSPSTSDGFSATIS